MTARASCSISHARFAREIPQPQAPEVDTGFLAGSGCGVAVLFLDRAAPVDPVKVALKAAMEPIGITTVLWRRVPLNKNVLSAVAAKTTPAVWQVVLRWDEKTDDVHTLRFLFKAQRRLEDIIRDRKLPVYVVSLSDRTIVYKGHGSRGTSSGRLSPTSSTRRFEVDTVVFHRRFPTNTSPNWSCVSRSRCCATTARSTRSTGNRQRGADWERYVAGARARRRRIWPAPALVPGAADSGDLDSAVQAYHAEGRSPRLHDRRPHAARRGRTSRAPLGGHTALFGFHKRAMGGIGAWEGPASLSPTTDGSSSPRWIAWGCARCA